MHALAGPVAAENLVEKLRLALDMNLRDLHRMTGYSEKSLSAWQSGKQEPGEAALRSLRSLNEFVAELSRVVKPAAIGAWLHKPNEVFRGLKPIELIERGEMKPLWWMIYDLESGHPT
jgi:transcriptional regulator with XRE-family HTH domain